MNKTLFCTLCCVSVAGFSSVVEEKRSPLECFLDSAPISSPEYQVLSRLDSVSQRLDNLCQFLVRFMDTREEITPLLQQLDSLYMTRLEQKLSGQRSLTSGDEVAAFDKKLESAERDALKVIHSLRLRLGDSLSASVYFSRRCDLIEDLQEVLKLLRKD